MALAPSHPIPMKNGISYFPGKGPTHGFSSERCGGPWPWVPGSPAAGKPVLTQGTLMYSQLLQLVLLDLGTGERSP